MLASYILFSTAHSSQSLVDAVDGERRSFAQTCWIVFVQVTINGACKRWLECKTILIYIDEPHKEIDLIASILAVNQHIVVSVIREQLSQFLSRVNTKVRERQKQV